MNPNLQRKPVRLKQSKLKGSYLKTCDFIPDSDVKSSLNRYSKVFTVQGFTRYFIVDMQNILCEDKIEQ